MSLAGTEVARTRARIATATRLGRTEELEEARRDHAAAKLAEHIRKSLSTAPPLTTEQRERIARLLTGGADA